MNDLELCVAFAKIDKPKGYLTNRYGEPLINDGTGCYGEYNPLTDKALLWDLILKYHVTLTWGSRIDNKCYIKKDGISWRSWVNESELSRAILEVIIEAYAHDK